MNIKQLNEMIAEALDDAETLLESRYRNHLISYRGSDKNDDCKVYDFGFIGFYELSENAFEKLVPHINKIEGVEKDLGNGIVFYTSGDNLDSREDGYVDVTIEVKNGVELNSEILDEFDKFIEEVYKNYIKLAGYKNLDGDIYDVAPIFVDFVWETSEDENIEDDVLAVFPEIDEGNNRCQCYRHIGQHGACDIDYYKSLAKATKEQYMDLYNELTDLIGYNLNVMNTDFNE